MSTMKAPRPPPSASPVTYLASGAHAIPPRFVLAAASAPERAEVPHRARIIVRPAIPFAGSLPRGREWDISGSQAAHPVPLPRSTTPAEPPFLATNGTGGAAPANSKAKASACREVRGYCVALAPAVYASRAVLPPPHARLASGWLAGLYREGVEPSGPR